MSEIDLLIEELEDIENNPIKPFVATRIGGYLRNYKYHEYRIAELEAAQRWIPVSERLPVGGKVLVLWKDRTIHLDWTFIDGGRYYWWNSGDNVTHWMPLPEPPEERER